MATAIYCGLSHMRAMLSTEGVDLAIDDDLSSWRDAANEASRQIDGYLLGRYAESSMEDSEWVIYATRTLACWLVTTRRGNPAPAGVQARYEKYIEDLQKATEGKFLVPGLSPRRAGVPTISLPRVVLHPVPRTVIERQRGSKRNLPQDYRQRVDQSERDFYSW